MFVALRLDELKKTAWDVVVGWWCHVRSACHMSAWIFRGSVFQWYSDVSLSESAFLHRFARHIVISYTNHQLIPTSFMPDSQGSASCEAHWVHRPYGWPEPINSSALRPWRGSRHDDTGEVATAASCGPFQHMIPSHKLTANGNTSKLRVGRGLLFLGYHIVRCELLVWGRVFAFFLVRCHTFVSKCFG